MTGRREYTTAADARAHAAAVTAEYRRHRIVCSQCHQRAGQGTGQCDTGWEMATVIARAASEARRLAVLSEAGQDKLF